jgi:hypothetical protein
MDSLWPAPEGVVNIHNVRVIALLSRADFAYARDFIGDLRRWADFDDYCLERDGEFLALSSAGIAACQQRVLLCAFCRWIRLTGAGRTLADLDSFAALWRVRRAHPEWPVRGALVVRDAAPTCKRLSSDQTLTIPIVKEIHVNWDKSVSSLKLFENANSINRHAALIAEACLSRRSTGCLNQASD